MKVNVDVREAVRRKKVVYPTKHTMNLYFKVDRTTAPATAALYLLFALAVLLGLAKFMVYDPWVQARQLETRALELETQTAAQLAELADYDQVLERYTRAMPTQRELALADCLAVLDLVDETVRSAAEISQLSVSENKVLLTFSGVDLGQAAALVSQLEQSPLVTSASVDTAVSAGENQNQVEVHVYFEVAGEEKNG